MGEVVVLSSDEGTMETMMSRGKSSEVVRWEKYLPTTVLRVLLVESDDSTRQIITALLQKCSYKVVAVSDGLAAWEILKEKTHNIDLILTELDLPAISGFALLALVMEHEACKHIPVIMMSSQDSMTMVLKCMLRGAADYLIKPMRKNELKNLWQHVWRRLTLRGDLTANGPSLPASQQNVEENDETCADSRYHSDHGSGSQAISDNGEDKLMGDVKPLFESFDVTMDLIGGIDKRSECYYGDNAREQHVGPELGLSLKRSCSERSLEKNQDESKHQKISLSDASAFSRYENGKAGGEKAVVVAVEASSSGEPKTPSESHEKLFRCDHGSATTSSNHENIGSSSVSGQNQFIQSGKQESLFPVESNRLKASKEVEVGCQSTNEGTVTAGGQSRSSSTREKAKEEEEEGEGGVTAQQRKSEREAALMKFRMKKKDRCFGKKMASSSPQHCHIIEVNRGKSAEESTTILASKACGEAPCGFSDLNNASGDAQERNASMRKLCIAVVLCLLFMTVEVFGGIKANSLAILTDAAHLLSDVAAFAISLFSLWAAGWEATPRQTYGFFRIEILGALVSIQLIWLLTGILVYEAIIRLLSETSEVNGFLMFLVAAFGLLVNIIMAVLLGHDHGHGHGHGHDHHSHGVTVTTHHHHHGHGEDKHHHHAHGDEDVTEQLLEKSEKRKRNINVQGAYLHVLGDSIQSVGVMIGGGIIWYNPEWKIVDLICTLVFSVIVLGTTINMIRSILEVLMESTPREIDATKLEKGLLEMEEVVAVHELHIWAITVGKVLLACHVNITPEADADMVLNKLLDQKVNVRRSLQVQASPEDHSFPLEEDQYSPQSLQGTRLPFQQMLQDPSSVLSFKDPHILGNYLPYEVPEFHSPFHSDNNHYYQNPFLEGTNEDISSQELQLNPVDNAFSRRKLRNNNLAASVSREKRKRRRNKPVKNREEMESQKRMTHIAVERNRRRQMNVHLNSLRSLIPSSYFLRGDQASIVGGAIDFVKILEQHLQSLEAQKITQQTSKLRIDATVMERHVSLKIQYCQRKQGQLLRSIFLLEKLGLTVLHLNVTSPCNASVSYSFNLKMEEDCNLGSVDEITAACHQSAMASLSISSSSTIINSRASPPGQASFSSPSCISLPMLPPKPLQSTAYCRKIARRNVPTRATEVEAPVTAEAETTELPEIVKTAQEAWEKVEDKYAIGSLAFAALLALWGSTGLISAIDRLPLFPGVFELVGIGYTGWFVYKNMIFKPDREVLFQKVKDTYRDILGSSS